MGTVNAASAQYAPSSSVYYSGKYWNDFPAVRAEINQRLTGDPAMQWYKFFHERVGGRRFRKALILNCGNGWVERAMYDSGVFDEALGVDCGADLIATAKEAAGTRAIRYRVMDVNTLDFGETGFDLVVNHASGHHIRWIDRVYCALAELLPKDGYFLQYDYVGPSRNQYAASQWEAIRALNDTLPAQARQDLRYPDHATMLSTDPTEAVHSGLILETTRRYFSIEHHSRAGGALAYPLLTHNQGIRELPDDARNEVVRAILDADGQYLKRFPTRSMFDLIIARPDHESAASWRKSGTFRATEERRERQADHDGGIYEYARLFTGSVRTVAGDWSRRYLRYGFGGAEAHGTWSIASSAVICFRAVSKESLRLVLDARPLIAKGTLVRQRVFAVVNGRFAGEFECAEQTKIAIPLPRSAPDNHFFRVVLLFPDADQPARFSISTDERHLGICISRLTLERCGCD